jgi:hypothetical protein
MNELVANADYEDGNDEWLYEKERRNGEKNGVGCSTRSPCSGDVLLRLQTIYVASRVPFPEVQA